MNQLPGALLQLLSQRLSSNSLRQLGTSNTLIDFSSNDYLGFANSVELFKQSYQVLLDRNINDNGATGSRLLTGNHSLYADCEAAISRFQDSESALLFNSGYDANIGLLSSVPQRGDTILYDELCHASIRDGIRLGNAKAYKFPHNDLEALQDLIVRHRPLSGDIYIATESVFSMDGDSPDLESMAQLCADNGCLLIVDEAHAVGVFGAGLIQSLKLTDKVFARIVTFGKGLGCHGAAILGSTQLKEYLVNFARSLIYTTALPPHSVATIISAYTFLMTDNDRQTQLRDNIAHFGQEKARIGLKPIFIRSKSAIQSVIIPGNESARRIAFALQSKGFDVRAILSPTVPEGQERLRFCIHSFNSKDEISDVLESLAGLLL